MKLARLATLVPAIALVALAGCSPAPTTAAEVGPTTISEAELSAAYDGCSELGFQVTRAAVLSPLVIGEAARQVARENDVDTSQLAEVLASDPQIAPFMANEGCARVGEASGLLTLLSAQMEQDEWVSAVVESDIQVNPRYGTWDEKSGTIGGSGSISVPAAAGS